MTPRQHQALIAIQRHFAIYFRAPSYEDIQADIGASSRGDVFRILHCLIDLGHITLSKNYPRSIRVIKPVIEGTFFIFDDQAKDLKPFVRALAKRGVA